MYKPKLTRKACEDDTVLWLLAPELKATQQYSNGVDELEEAICEYEYVPRRHGLPADQ
jgi:hypothetical protein